MTQFNRSLFEYHGGYLTYKGDYEGRPTYQMPCHPTRLGTGKDLFIARFKYRGPFTKAKVMKKVMELFTVEEYATRMMEQNTTPLGLLEEADPIWYADVMAKARA